MLKPIICSCMFLLLPLCVNNSFAQDSDDRLSDCLSSAGNTQSMRECVFNEVQIYDAKLNTYYKAIMAEAKKEDPALAEQFKLSQRAWIKFTEQNTNFYIKNPGSLYLVEADLAYLQYLKNRVEEFENIMNMYGLDQE